MSNFACLWICQFGSKSRFGSKSGFEIGFKLEIRKIDGLIKWITYCVVENDTFISKYITHVLHTFPTCNDAISHSNFHAPGPLFSPHIINNQQPRSNHWLIPLIGNSVLTILVLQYVVLKFDVIKIQTIRHYFISKKRRAMSELNLGIEVFFRFWRLNKTNFMNFLSQVWIIFLCYILARLMSNLKHR